MKITTKKKTALVGLAGSFLISSLLVYWFLADLIARVALIQRESAIRYAMSLLILLTVVRALLILRDKDEITNFIDRHFD